MPGRLVWTLGLLVFIAAVISPRLVAQQTPAAAPAQPAAQQERQRLAQQGVVGHPLRGPGEVRLHRFRGPLVEHVDHVRPRRTRLQSQRIAAEIRLLASLVPGHVVLVAQLAQEVCLVERFGVLVGMQVSHGKAFLPRITRIARIKADRAIYIGGATYIICLQL